MTEGILDTLLMIIVLAIVLAISFTVILPLVNSDIMSYNEVLQDKGVMKDVRDASVEGTTAEPNDIYFDARGVVLTVHVQDENMPKPRGLRVENNAIIPVNSAYKMEVINIGRAIFNQLPSKTSLYSIKYDYENGGSYKIKEIN